METIAEIAKYAVPAILMLIVTYLLMSSFLENEEKRRRYFLKKETQKNALPLRLQAFERITLFLERITPNSLMVRISAKNLTVQQYQSILLKSIRNEFEHNLSQQIYVSDEAWRLVNTAKSTTVSIINKAASELDPDAPGAELSKKILMAATDLDQFPTRRAVAYLKQEVRDEF